MSVWTLSVRAHFSLTLVRSSCRHLGPDCSRSLTAWTLACALCRKTQFNIFCPFTIVFFLLVLDICLAPLGLEPLGQRALLTTPRAELCLPSPERRSQQTQPNGSEPSKTQANHCSQRASEDHRPTSTRHPCRQVTTKVLGRKSPHSRAICCKPSPVP